MAVLSGWQDPWLGEAGFQVLKPMKPRPLLAGGGGVSSPETTRVKPTLLAGGGAPGFQDPWSYWGPETNHQDQGHETNPLGWVSRPKELAGGFKTRVRKPTLLAGRGGAGFQTQVLKPVILAGGFKTRVMKPTLLAGGGPGFQDLLAGWGGGGPGFQDPKGGS